MAVIGKKFKNADINSKSWSNDNLIYQNILR
jgi:hypothetical protein